jgi:hypothetical protein
MPFCCASFNKTVEKLTAVHSSFNRTVELTEGRRTKTELLKKTVLQATGPKKTVLQAAELKKTVEKATEPKKTV